MNSPFGGHEPTRLERLLVLNFYGTALLAGAPILALAGIWGGRLLGFGMAVTLVVAIVPVLVIGVFGGRVTSRLPNRERVFGTLLRRIERKGFDARYFENLCGDLCMRRVTWLVLRRVGQQHRYAKLVQAYRKNSTFYLLHSSPEIQDLIDSGSLPESNVREAVLDQLGLAGLPVGAHRGTREDDLRQLCPLRRQARQHGRRLG